MINLAILCIVCALAYAFRGGQIFVTEWEKRLEWLTAQPNPTPEQRAEIAELEKRWWPKKLRKPIYCIVTGAAFGLLAWDIWAGVIVAIGSLLPPLTSPRPLFWGWQNVYRAEEVKKNIFNWHQYWVADKYVKLRYHYSPAIAVTYSLDWIKAWSAIYGAMRGLWELPTTIALAVYYSNPIIALWGLLGGFMGVAYLIAGKLSKDHATRYAELGYGFLRGVMLAGVLVTTNLP